MYDKNYEEYMSTVLGYNINQENTYCNYDYDNFSYDLEKNYPDIYKDLCEKIKQIDIQTCQNNFDEIAQNLYKELKIKENTKDMKNLIIDLLKILIIKEKVAERQSEIQNKNMYLNRGMRRYSPYVDF
jgi:DNA-binding transcriptional regulator GbsR (MarR family)